jgi:hypothetical protein
MKQWIAMVAAVVLLALPIMVSAGEETVVPPEAGWSPTPSTPTHLMVPQERVVSTEQEQASDVSRPTALKMSRGPLALTENDGAYQVINSTVHTD